MSRVTNDEPNVRPETRARVQAAVAALNYRPDPNARSLAGRRSWLLALLYDNPSASYLIDIQTGALTTSRAAGYEVVIHPSDYKSPELEDRIRAMVAQSSVDGILLTPPLSDMTSLARTLDEIGVPCARVAPLERRPDRCEVYTNDREACAEMTNYLVSLGHRRIGFICGHPDHRALAERFAGYRDGLRANDLPVADELVAQGYNSFESGVECARQLLKLRPRPTAIFASNDDMAAGVMRVAHETGLGIPHDLSVAGFDDLPLASQLWPSLTTIRQPIQAMASRATELLLLQLRDEPHANLPRVIDSSLVVRGSTGPVASHATAAAEQAKTPGAAIAKASNPGSSRSGQVHRKKHLS